MNEYRTFCFDIQPNWNLVPAVELTNCRWDVGNLYNPKTVVKICCVNKKGIYVRMKSDEEPVRAIYTQRDSPVYTDSCMEFFFQPFDFDDSYMNFEINPCCCCLSAIGTDRNNRTFLRDITDTGYEISALQAEFGWGVELFIPQSLISECFKTNFKAGNCTSIRANVYKCADLSERPHYQALFPVDTTNPDFHRPEFFGKITFSDERKSAQ